MPDWVKRAAASILTPIVKSAVSESLAKADSPNVTEVPTSMTIGYQYTGGARRKYQATLDFDTLRNFSVLYDVARACINHRKRQINNLEWAIVPRDDEQDSKEFQRQIDEVTAFFDEPVHGHDFKMFVDKIMEDLLVIDGAALWKDKTFKGKLKELLPVDSTTIRIKVSPDGTLPEPPEAAYQQVIYGEVKGEYTTDEMYYKLMNPRNNTPYGLSPLECLVIGVDSALRSQMYNSQLLSEGTTPEGFLALPSEWTPDQIKDYQMWFDSMMAGNMAQTARIKMIPGGKGVGYLPTKKAEDMRMLEFEKWLLFKTCAMFDVQPSAIGFIENLPQNPGDQQKQLGQERGLIPMANFLKSFFTHVIAKDFGYTMLKFEWKGLQVVDDTFELDRNVKMLQNGALTINEWRNSQGLDPIEDEAADMPMVFTAGGPVPLEAITAEEEGGEGTPGQPAGNNEGSGKDAELEEMQKWEAMALNCVKRGKPIREFKAEHIDKAVQTLLGARLHVAKSKEEVRAAFKPFKEDLVERVLIGDVLRVTDRVSKFKRAKYERTGSRS